MAGAGSDVDVSTALSCARCGKQASLQFPKCVELKLPRQGSAFCTHDCFKASWSAHKAAHLKPQAVHKWDEHYRMLRPYPISPKHFVPAHIDLPDWPLDESCLLTPVKLGNPKFESNSDLQHVVEIKTSGRIAIMRETCRIAREVLDVAARMIRPGVTTDEIDRAVHDATIEPSTSKRGN